MPKADVVKALFFSEPLRNKNMGVGFKMVWELASCSILSDNWEFYVSVKSYAKCG